jgi:hypothetical protein
MSIKFLLNNPTTRVLRSDVANELPNSTDPTCTLSLFVRYYPDEVKVSEMVVRDVFPDTRKKLPVASWYTSVKRGLATLVGQLEVPLLPNVKMTFEGPVDYWVMFTFGQAYNKTIYDYRHQIHELAIDGVENQSEDVDLLRASLWWTKWADNRHGLHAMVEDEDEDSYPNIEFCSSLTMRVCYDKRFVKGYKVKPNENDWGNCVTRGLETLVKKTSVAIDSKLVDYYPHNLPTEDDQNEADGGHWIRWTFKGGKARVIRETLNRFAIAGLEQEADNDLNLASNWWLMNDDMFKRSGISETSMIFAPLSTVVFE